MTTSSSDPADKGAAPPRTATPYSRFIPREELGAFAAWTPGSLQAEEPPASPPPPDAAAVQAQLAAARQGGYQDGYRDGLVALDGFKHSFAAQMAAQIGRLLESFDAQLGALEHQMARAVAESAVLLARRVVRQELQTTPAAVAEVARQAVQAVLLSARHIRVQVHPEDLPLVAAGAGEALAARGAHLEAAQDIERGGCRVESDLGEIDARIATRWRQAAQMLGSDQPWSDDAVDAAPPAAP